MTAGSQRGCSTPDPEVVAGAEMAVSPEPVAGAEVAANPEVVACAEVAANPEVVAGAKVAGNPEAGAATLIFPMVLWVATLIAIVIIDVGGYFVAAARAQSLADAAALAAVSADVPGVRGQIPAIEARRIATAGGGRLEHCTCVRGSERASVTVSVSVPGLVMPELGASRVAADASAVLAPPADLAPGPTRERARWPVGPAP